MTRHGILVAAIIAAVLGAARPGVARADDVTAAASVDPRSFGGERRLFGIGAAMTVGGAHSFRPDTQGNYWVSQFPALSLHLPLSPRLEAELRLPIVAMIAGAVGYKLLLWAELFAVVRPIARLPGAVISPGIGVIYMALNDAHAGVSVQVPVRLGYEISSRRGGFGVLLAARPWVERMMPTQEYRSAWGVGIFLDAEFRFYVMGR